MMLAVSYPSVKSLPESRTAAGEHTVCDGWGWPVPCRDIYFKVLAVEMKTYLIQTVRMIVDGYSYNVANIALGRTVMANAQLASLSINTPCLLHGYDRSL